MSQAPPEPYFSRAILAPRGETGQRRPGLTGNYGRDGHNPATMLASSTWQFRNTVARRQLSCWTKERRPRLLHEGFDRAGGAAAAGQLPNPMPDHAAE